jgi:hypothetical protein
MKKISEKVKINERAILGIIQLLTGRYHEE